ncbi:MAG: DUF362 domain-containing protein [Clostridia bacterium]|nr:DUF362 domain-containing protein [Clostridia bacterium]
MRNIVSVTACPDYEPQTVRAALKELLKPFGALSFVKPGAKIVIKANLVSMIKPENAATTHPELLKALCEMLVEKGADVVVGDSPGGLFNNVYVNRVYAVTGLKAVTETGARLNQNFEHAHAQNPDGAILKDLEYTSYLDDADAIINFCKLKTHGMMSLSACVKNMFGAVPGTFKPEYHYKYSKHADFADMLVDLNERFRPALCLVDAVTGMEGNGPTAGTPRHIGCLLASDSPYCCDRVCAGIIGLNPDEVETVAAAKRRGLESEFDICGQPDAFRVSDYKLVRERKDMSFDHELPGLAGKLAGKFIQGALSSKPAVKKAMCLGCEKCREVCPAKAIVMKDKVPVIDRKKCIRCFCCQEFCPKGAMQLHRPIIAKVLNRRG